MQKIKTFINENKNYIHRDANGNHAQFDEQIDYLYLEDVMGTGTYYTRQETGYTLNKHEYDAWGYNTKAATYNYDPEYRATEPYFTGHPYDGALNLYYAHNRFFDAQTGQWLSEDPIKSGLNWYQYCNSNPTSYVDVLGLEGEEGLSQKKSSKDSKDSREPDADVYIFFQVGMYDAVEVENMLFYREEDYDRYINSLKEPFEGQKIELIMINDKVDFIQKWNNLPDNDITVVLNLHGYPEGLVFDQVEKIAEGKFRLKKHEVLSSYEILTSLDYKEIDIMYNLCCNSYGYHELEEVKDHQESKENPLLVANAFQVHGVKEQLVSVGYVSSDQSLTLDSVYWGPVYTKLLSEEEAVYNGMTKEKNLQGNFYAVRGCKTDGSGNYIAAIESKLFSNYETDSSDYSYTELYRWEFIEIIEEADKKFQDMK